MRTAAILMRAQAMKIEDSVCRAYLMQKFAEHRKQDLREQAFVRRNVLKAVEVYTFSDAFAKFNPEAARKRSEGKLSWGYYDEMREQAEAKNCHVVYAGALDFYFIIPNEEQVELF